jgi:hypothetical protein
MPITLRINVPADVTPMRHDATGVLDARGVSVMILVAVEDRAGASAAGRRTQ